MLFHDPHHFLQRQVLALVKLLNSPSMLLPLVTTCPPWGLLLLIVSHAFHGVRDIFFSCFLDERGSQILRLEDTLIRHLFATTWMHCPEMRQQ